MRYVLIAAVCMSLLGCQTQRVMEVSCHSPAGARTSGPALVGEPYGMQFSPVPLNAVLFTGAFEPGTIAVQRLSAHRSATDTVVVNATFVNCTSSSLHLKVRTSFFAKDQQMTEAPSAWRSVFIQSRALGTYSESSIARATVDSYLIEISNAIQP